MFVRVLTYLLVMPLLFGCAAKSSFLTEGIGHFNAERYGEAVSVFSEGIGAQDAELAWLYKMRAAAHMRLGQYDLALADLDRFFAPLPGWSVPSDPVDLASGYLMRGTILFHLGRLAEAEEAYERCLSFVPSQSHADALKALDQLDQAALNTAGFLGTALDMADGGTGALVIAAVPGSPAEKAGIRRGDRIVGADGTPIANWADLLTRLAVLRPGAFVAIELLRDGASSRVTVVLDENPFRREERRILATGAKPPLPEAARKYRIQAEGAVGRKAFAEAAERYADALRVAPWWAEGHYNRALILAELGRHAHAIREMRRYLALVPGAADARSAQDQIYAWEAFVR